MIKIRKGIVFSYDIQRILNGVNAFDFQYDFIPSGSMIQSVREDFQKSTSQIFNGNVSILSEEDMMDVNSLLGGRYPHCQFR